MYIRKIEITNIKGIEHFEMDFSELSKPGWHVLIGDNGSGKTTILRAIGLIIVGTDDARVVVGLPELNGNRWVRNGKSESSTKLLTTDSSELMAKIDPFESFWDEYQVIQEIIDSDGRTKHSYLGRDGKSLVEDPLNWFFSGYGPFRRLSGKRDSIFLEGRKSWFGTLYSDEEGLDQSLNYLSRLKLASDSEPEKEDELNFLIKFINTSELLPDRAILTKTFGSEGIKIKDAAGNEVYFRDASDGYRSILSLTLDLLKNMIAHYGIEKVMQNATANQIKLPGVVLIDEVDAHLHPNWQVRIGKWFTDFFPEIQFIVTTHSPLICRGCGEKGQIWHLKTQGSTEESGPVSELQRKRLVFGDILDAYDTGVFGPNQSSENSIELRERLAALNMMSIKGAINDEERKELESLRSFL